MIQNNPNEDNIVLSYMAKVLEHRLNNDKAELDALLDETSEVTVTLADVVVALDVILDDLSNLIDYDQELNEYRLRAIVESLDEVAKAKVKAKFEAAEDDLFTEGENN